MSLIYWTSSGQAIQANARGAKLIWTTSTPERIKNDMSQFKPWTKQVIVRNKIADAYVRKVGIPIDDLYTAVLHHPEFFVGGDGTHPNSQRRAAEARDVAASVLKALGK